MAKLTKEQIKQAVLQQIEDAEGYETDELAAMREQALNYYYNRESAAPHMMGRSDLQSSTVADMVEHVVTQVMPAFEGELIAEFPANNEDDIEQARAESMAVSHVLMDLNNGEVELEEAIRDALLMRNGILKVYLDEKISTDVQHLVDLTELEFGDLVRNSTDNLNNVDNGHTVTETSERDDGFHDVRVTVKNTERKICVDAIDPANFSWERDYDSIYLDDCRFVAERFLPTRSELIEMGYDKRIVNKLNAGGNDTQIDSLARNQHSQRRNWQGATRAEDIIETHVCHVRLDADGDGMAELLRVVIANKTLLEVEEADYIPYASGTPFLQPHRFNGLGLFDKLKNIQDQQTHGLRQWADNLNHANNTRLGYVDGSVNPDDLLNSRPAGLVRMTSADAIVPIVSPDIGPSALAFLEYGDKLRSERGGAAIDLGTAEMQVAGNTAHGVERQTASKEQMAAKMTKTIAQTLVKTTYELIHRALRLYYTDDIQYMAGSEFQVTNPAQWLERKRVKVKGGISVADKAKKVMALEQAIVRQDALIQQGYYVSPNDVFNAHTDWLRAQGVNATERYLTDPQSEEASQDMQQRQQEQAAQQQYQQMLLELQKEIEDRKANNEDAKVFENARQFDQELEFKYWEKQYEQNAEDERFVADQALNLVQGGQDDEQGDGANAA